MTSFGFLRGAAVSAAALLCAQSAYAQGVPAPVPMVVDVDYIQQHAAAALDVEKQLFEAQQSYEKQLSSRDSALHQTQQDLIKQQQDLSKPQAPPTASADFEKKRKDFEQNVAAFQEEVRQKRASLDKANQIAMAKINTALQDVIVQIAKKRHANLVMVKAMLILYLPSYDATEEALKMLNDKVPSMKVVIPKPSEVDADQGPAPAPPSVLGAPSASAPK
jgi:Skp family chaperone for outer membrane proteins